MPLVNYTDLAAAIPSWLHRDDLLAADINNFVNLAEANLVRKLAAKGVQQLERRSTATMTSGINRVALPTDFLRMRGVQINTNPVRSLVYKTPEAIDELMRQSRTGKPTFFTMTDCEIQFDTLTDAAYTLEIAYYYRPTLLSSGNLTNTLTTISIDAVFYGALLEAGGFMFIDPNIELKWKGRYDLAIESVLMSSWMGKHSGSSLAVTVI
jgi:hypothetical protein